MKNIDGRAQLSELGGLSKALEAQFDTLAYQKKIEALANAMTIEDIMKKHICSRIAALDLLYHEVGRLNEQFPKVKRGSAFKTQTLMKIVRRYEWSRTAEEEFMQEKLSYDTLFTNLSAAIFILENELTRECRDPKQADDRRAVSVAPPHLIYFEVQYANNMQRRPYARSLATRNTGLQRQYNLQDGNPQDEYRRNRFNSKLKSSQQTRGESRCFKCERHDHWRAECPSEDSHSLVLAVRARIREIGEPPNQAAAKILFQLANEKDE